MVKRGVNDTMGVMGRGGWYSINVTTRAGFSAIIGSCEAESLLIFRNFKFSD